MIEELEAPAKKIKSTAPGTYLGFAIQPVRMCHHLMTVPSGGQVSMEYVDDIAIHNPDNSLVLEQCKSALTGNPTADSSSELWKTFANWARLCKENEIDLLSTVFHLYVCTSKSPGPLVMELHAAKSEQQAKNVLSKIAKKVTSKNAEKGCNPKISEFLSYDDELKLAIICNFELIVANDPLEAIRTILEVVIQQEHVNSFAEAAIGQASIEIAALIRAKQKPIIDGAVFRQKFQAYIRKYNWTGVLQSTTEPPTKDHASKVVETAPYFIQQLQFVDAHQETLVRAAADFLQSEADRTNWAAHGVIVANSIDEFDDQLHRSYSLQKSEIEDTLSNLEEKARGRTLYVRCSQVSISLEGRPVPTYFVPGSYNILANELKLGWHPQYIKLFGNS